MGLEIIRLKEELKTLGPKIQPKDLAQLDFKTRVVADPTMFIWLMTLARKKEVFPWWGYLAQMDDDINSLSKTWSITSAQQMFDCLFLNLLYRLAGKNLYVIFPGNVKSKAWGKISGEDRRTFLQGQGCVYHLDALLEKRLAINWVPFYQPQSLARSPGFDSLWRIFSANQDDHSDVNCLTLFSLSDINRLPEVTRLLIDKEENRSKKLSQIVDWFGVFSSPLKAGLTATSVLYTKNKNTIRQLAMLEKNMTQELTRNQMEFIEKPIPQTALRILSRSIVR